MKHLVFVAGLITLGCAFQPASARAAAANPAANVAPAPDADAQSADRLSSTCITDTGSRIKPPKGECIGTAIGRSYSLGDIQSTGKTNAADALHQLDPSVNITGLH